MLKVQVPEENLQAAYLFNTGQSYRADKFFGITRDKAELTFRVWAPHAKAVHLASAQCDWMPSEAFAMHPLEETGVWEITTTALKEGDLYKYAIETPAGDVVLRTDPFAHEYEKKPGVAAVVNTCPYKWHDGLYRGRQGRRHKLNQPINIYEVHMTSWRRHTNGSYLSYRELADELIPYVKQMGYTHIEMLPITEHLLDMSWGYQSYGFFAATSRMGYLQDLQYFVDEAHKANLGVILDFVPGHFIKNYDALYRFDGTPTFEAGDVTIAENVRWGTWNFDLGKSQVQSFLISAALFWLEDVHFDGLRVDGVSNIIYLNQDAGKEDWVNEHGTAIDYAGVAFLQKLNAIIHERVPSALMFAEEATAYPGVTKPEGLGFDFKWNMGWMHDTLDFFELDYLYRTGAFNNLTFSFMYTFDEQFTLPLSHDEVVHGKKSLMHKMFGDRYNQFANLRTMMVWMMAHPGKKLRFMGSEWGQFLEWRDEEGLEWRDLQDGMNRSMQHFTAELNKLYRDEHAFWAQDFVPAGVNFSQTDQGAQGTMALMRHGKKPSDTIIMAMNTLPVQKDDYRVIVPRAGRYDVLLNTEDIAFGGTWQHIPTDYEAFLVGDHYEISVILPATGALIIKQKKQVRGKNNG
ncbi:1,4-alpha-glucan branching protein GlgB [Weissella cibaria]|uniref:1,4-alpha-glucan branching protein GlgB n=1 Tax=Weissella cibaria TaxID=137591 RepID=UPI001197347C|nr:1,4-alpha-glucan branching protein GlgB [Weissella cibaria]TVV18235.1 1,4-alpha-glucan branching protein GlgB [Weissella cibaria]